MSQEPAAKLTGSLLARKGQARPAELLEGDSELLCNRQGPSLTLIRREDAPAETDSSGEVGDRPDEDDGGPSSSLSLFDLARPDRAESPEASSPSAASTAEHDEAPCSEEEGSAQADGNVGSAVPQLAEEHSFAPPAFEPEQAAAPAEAQQQAATVVFRSGWRQAALWSLLLLVSFALGLWLVLSFGPAPSKPGKEVLPQRGELGLSLDQSKVSAIENAKNTASDAALTDLDQIAAPAQKLGETAPQPDDGAANLVLTGATSGQAQSTAANTAEPVRAENPPVGGVAEESQEALPPLPSRNPRAVQQAVAVAVSEPETGYALQLFAGRNASRASEEKLRLTRAFPELEKAGPLKILEVDVEGYGSFYRIRSAVMSDDKLAQSLCRGIKAKGQDCFVVKQ